MKSVVSLFVVMFIFISTSYGDVELSFATWNIRYANAKDSINGDGWEKRASEIAKLIKYHSYDIVNMQEMETINGEPMILTLMENLDDYDVVKGLCEECADYNPIVFNKRRVSLLNSGQFYFAENPDSVSKSWDSYLRRYCTWAQFAVKQDTFFVFNVHWDHKGIEARRQSAMLSLRKIPEIASGKPSIYAGDINCEAKYDCYKMLKSDYWTDARLVADDVYLADSSFNNFKMETLGKKTLDVIFVTPSIKVRRYGIQRELYYDGERWRFPSDHNSVAIKIRIE